MSGYKILKLRSGESVIAKIKKVNKDSKSVVLDRPMSLRIITMMNEMGVGQEEQVIVKRYNAFSSDSVVEIPTSYVVSLLTPTQDTIEMYDREKVFEDNPQLRYIAQQKAEQRALHDFIEKQRKLKEIAEQMGMHEENDMPPPDGPFQDFSALMLPNEAIRQLLDMMGLDWNRAGEENIPPTDQHIEEDIHESLEELDDEDLPYGSRWQDWDIEDFN